MTANYFRLAAVVVYLAAFAAVVFPLLSALPVR